jgi:hypothetical protein
LLNRGARRAEILVNLVDASELAPCAASSAATASAANDTADPAIAAIEVLADLIGASELAPRAIRARPRPPGPQPPARCQGWQPAERRNVAMFS